MPTVILTGTEMVEKRQDSLIFEKKVLSTWFALLRRFLVMRNHWGKLLQSFGNFNVSLSWYLSMAITEMKWIFLVGDLEKKKRVKWLAGILFFVNVWKEFK